ncbi:MAG: site-specific integrase [Chlorobi bacterium]|nr:site-specific integrase [Chlorobiota bacterium]
MTQVRNKMRATSYSEKTIEAYVKWIKEFVLFNDKKHPSVLGKEQVENFLAYLAVKRNVSASTQNQALSAILYLYKNIIPQNIGWLNDVVRAHKSRRLPVVFTKEEVKRIPNRLNLLSGIVPNAKPV